jgi:Ca-activated chloride channel family protein
MPQLRMLTCAALVGMSCLAVPAMPAIADENGQPRTEYAPTMLVLDASGSMAGADPGGGTKMEAAKRATRLLIDAAPEGAPVGLAVYGTNTGSTPAEKEAGCADVTVLRGPEPIDRAALAGAVDPLRPRGYTPIGAALRKADEALPDSGPRSIVLVSDGADTCAPPDPCDVAKELSAGGTDLVVHAVGFGVDDPARAQLTCVAQSTGGTYTDAPDAPSLERVLPRVTQTALRNYQAAGIPVTGTPDVDGAPQLRPGQYLDTLALDRRRHYAVDIPAGATVYFSATVAYARTNTGFGVDQAWLEARMYAADGTDCQLTNRSRAAFAADGEVSTVSLVWYQTRTSRCKTPGRYVFGVVRQADNNQPTQLPVEILVGIEPGVAGQTGEPATTEPVAFERPGGPERPVTGGGSFGTAATLDGPGVYTDALRSREFVFYRVRLDWGQGLAYRVTYGDTPRRPTSNIETTLHSPFRAPVESSSTGYYGEAKTLPDNSPAIATPEIRYRNRDRMGGENVGVAGWYYISVKLGRELASRNPADRVVPVRLEVSVTGQAESAPGYGFASESARSAGVFGESAARPASSGTSASVDPASASQPFPTLWVLGGGGLVALGLVVIVTTLLANRRHRQRLPR